MIKRKHISMLLFAAAVSFAGTANAQSTVNDKFQPFLTRGKTTWSANVGVRVNTFDWNIASDTTGTATPNILSELTWRDVTLLELNGEVRHEEPLDLIGMKGGLHLAGRVNLGLPISGENQDSDYNGDNRTGEFSRTIGDAGGYAVGAQAEVGYKIYLTGDPKSRARQIMNSPTPRTAAGRARKARALKDAIDSATPAITLTPLIGYSVDQQRYSMTNIKSVIPATGTLAVDDFDAHYQSNWYGAFAGLETEIKGQKNMVRLRGEYQDLNFYGEGYWRGRPTFRQDPSYRHNADGDGYLLSAAYEYAMDDDYALTLDAMYKLREATDGDNELYLTDNTVSRTKLNEVNDESYGLHIGLRYDW